MVKSRDPRLAWVLLGLAMLASLGICLYVTRGTTFSGDEMTWVAFAPGMDLHQALEPHSGHLVLVSHLLYKYVLETIGNDYLTFRLLTLLTVLLSVGLFFVWARRRVGDWLALAPCLVLLFFGSDAGHLLQGNGFTIMLAIACGMAALVALDSHSRKGDLTACAALCLGTITYTVALPFIVGAAVVILARENRWRRAWVFVVPAAIYGAWRIWVLASNTDFTRGGIEPGHILLLPAWTFQSLGGTLAALAGLNFDFSGGPWLEPTAFAAPTLAVAFMVLFGLRVSRWRTGPVFWAAVAVALAMFSLQVLSWIPEVREPATSRYLFPCAFVVLIVAVEAAARFEISRTVLIVAWLIALSGLGANLTIAKDSGGALRARTQGLETQITAATLINRAGFFFPGPEARPLVTMVDAPGISIIGEAADRYGGLGFPQSEIPAQPAAVRDQIDSILIRAIDPHFGAFPGHERARGCSPAAAFGNEVWATELPVGGATVVGKRSGTVRVWRFGDSASNTVGTLRSGRPVVLSMPDDHDPHPWKLTADTPFEVCALPTS
jgi:hypothetical protein